MSQTGPGPGVFTPASRRVCAFDTETYLIAPARLAPPMVCLSWQFEGEAAQLAHVDEAEPIIRGWLDDPNVVLVGHNVAFDCAVIAEEFPHLRNRIFHAYRDNRITCTKICQQLLDIAGGVYRRKHVGKGVFIQQNYDLESVAKRYGFHVQKDAWRTSYGEFRNVPLARWHEHATIVQARGRARLAELDALIAEGRLDTSDKRVAKEIEGLRDMVQGDPSRVTAYPKEDAVATLTAFKGQVQHARWLANQWDQARAYFALHLDSAWGLRTDEHGVSILERETRAAIAELEEELTELGLVRADGTRDTKAAKRRMIDICLRDGLVIPRTATHADEGKCKTLDGKPLPDGADECEDHVCLDADACEASEDEALAAYANYSTQKKVLTNDVKSLLTGIRWPIHTSYGLAETGRTTSSRPNIQNVTKREGMRECYVARPGYVFAQCDYPTLELYTLAQCCLSWLGESKLAEALNGGLDPHIWFAASMRGMDYAEAERAHKDKTHPRHEDIKRARQLAKPANFGFPGGMGAEKFVTATRKQVGRKAFAEMGLDVPRAKRLKEEWLAAWPEMRKYFERVAALCDNPARKATVETLFTQRSRGQASFCAACNNGFQGLASDIAKRAAWYLAWAQYVDEAPRSPLFNSRTPILVHDEFIAEVRDDGRAHDAAYELARIMGKAANEFLPDVPMPLAKLQPALMKRWSKKAESKFDAEGRLIVWSP